VNAQTIVNAGFNRVVGFVGKRKKREWKNITNISIPLHVSELSTHKFRCALNRFKPEGEGWSLQGYALVEAFHEVRYCEFTGDDKHSFDEFDHKKRCEHIGYRNGSPSGLHCMKYQQDLVEDGEGWVRSRPSCEQPVQIKKVKL
jgi:hypothetical protein